MANPNDQGHARPDPTSGERVRVCPKDENPVASRFRNRDAPSQIVDLSTGHDRYAPATVEQMPNGHPGWGAIPGAKLKEGEK